MFLISNMSKEIPRQKNKNKKLITQDRKKRKMSER